MSKGDKMEEYMSIKEFAAMMKMHPNSIRRSIKNGKLQAVRVGFGGHPAYRIPKSEISRIALFDLKDMVNAIMEEKINRNKE